MFNYTAPFAPEVMIFSEGRNKDWLIFGSLSRTKIHIVNFKTGQVVANFDVKVNEDSSYQTVMSMAQHDGKLLVAITGEFGWADRRDYVVLWSIDNDSMGQLVYTHRLPSGYTLLSQVRVAVVLIFALVLEHSSHSNNVA
jgi:WD40 repeat protein